MSTAERGGEPLRPTLLIARDRSALAGSAADWIAEHIAATVAEHGSCAIALAGGTTPAAAYARLARAAVPWSAVRVYFGDERAVPPDDPASNYHMARETLLRHVPIPRTGIHRMEAESEDPDEAARRYEAVLPDRLDLLLLGVGADGHTASLFPGAPALEETHRHVVPADSPAPPVRRLTITPPVIAAARRVAVLVAGAAKAMAVARALEGALDPREVPAQLARGGTWLLDAEAASLLQKVPA
ncbi:MAG TPA: 6-phosphogluconolactonase [Gemmatimonadaceae bacterium]|nr:6-phosphogluconolactonase [Gemmatimonadaceae bacterium]